MNTTLLLATLGMAGATYALAPSAAPVAKPTATLGVSATKASRLATGWSVRDGILGRTVYNDAGARIGNIKDLIFDPDRNAPYVIIGAGGFIGAGRHDVVVPIAQIHGQTGRIVMPGATRDAMKAMPAFDHLDDQPWRGRPSAKAGKTRG